MDIQIRRFKNRKTGESRNLIYSDYFKTTRIHSGIATIPPKGKSNVDAGHKNSEEVYTLCKGSIIVVFPDTNEECRLDPGDSLLIPPGISHMVENRENMEAILIYSAAPPM